jgi:hypothetical protein
VSWLGTDSAKELASELLNLSVSGVSGKVGELVSRVMSGVSASAGGSVSGVSGLRGVSERVDEGKKRVNEPVSKWK